MLLTTMHTCHLTQNATAATTEMTCNELFMGLKYEKYEDDPNTKRKKLEMS
jgi:hypothetical protein